MDANQLRSYLTARRIPFEERAVQSGVQFRCPTGETVTLYDTGKALVQGKPTPLKADLQALVQTPAPTSGGLEGRGQGEASPSPPGYSGRAGGLPRGPVPLDSHPGVDVVIYTDGACLRNPSGPGGYGVVLLSGGQVRELAKGYRRTTNNRMELLAAIVGLEAVGATSLRPEHVEGSPSKVHLHSDSQYLVRAMNEGWPHRWREKGWRLVTGAPAKNPDLWQRLLDLADRHHVQFEWVPGHRGNLWNERCDRLAVAAAKGKDLAVDEGYEAA